MVWLRGQGRKTNMSGGATEWEDILIQQGIIKAPKKPEDDQPELVFDISNKFGDESPDELDDLVDDDDEFFTQYKYRDTSIISESVNSNHK